MTLEQIQSEGLDLPYATWESLYDAGYIPSNASMTQRKITEKTYAKIATDIKPNEVVLDFSSGLGNGTKVLRDLGFTVDAYEPFYNNIQGVAKPEFDSSYDIPSDYYDVIINNAVLNVVPNSTATEIVEEIYRVLKPGGRAYVSVRSWSGAVKSLVKNGTIVGPREVLTSKKTFQRGYTTGSLLNFVSTVLPQAELSPSPFGDIKVKIVKKI